MKSITRPSYAQELLQTGGADLSKNMAPSAGDPALPPHEPTTRQKGSGGSPLLTGFLRQNVTSVELNQPKMTSHQVT
jgi:hypothetical protein